MVGSVSALSDATTVLGEVLGDAHAYCVVDSAQGKVG